MTAPPIQPPIPSAIVSELSVSITDHDVDYTVYFRNEGSGFYVVLQPLEEGKGIYLDPGEAAAFGQWAADMCVFLDAQETRHRHE